MKSWEEFRDEVRRHKAQRWPEILASEPPGRPAGRRPRDPEQEALLAELDRLRLLRSPLHASARRVPAAPDNRAQDGGMREPG